MISRLFIVLIITVFVSCSSDDVSPIDELMANRQLWESSKIDDYKWNEIVSCECGGPLTRDIFVKNGKKERVDFDESLLVEGLTYEYIFNTSRTIEEAFEFIEDLLSQNVASLYIEYDPTYGFPTIIGIDYDANVVDDEISYRYTNFEISL